MSITNEQVRFDYGAGQMAEQDFHRCLAAYVLALDGMNTALQPLFTTWQSDGNDVFVAKKGRWTQTFEELKGIGETMKAHVAASGVDYKTTDNRVGSYFA